MKKELRFCIEYVCPTHPLNDDGSVNIRHFRTLSGEEAENALVLLLECGCKLIDLYKGNVQDGKLAEWSPLPMIVNQNEDFYVDGDFDSHLNKGDRDMTQEETKTLLSKLIKKFENYENEVYKEIHFMREHNFRMEEKALRYKAEAFATCKLDLMELLYKE